MRQADLVGLIELSRYAEKQLLSSLGSSIDLRPSLCARMFVGVCVCMCVFEGERGERQQPV